MHPFFQHPYMRRARTVFRWCRICVWLALFLVVALAAYMHLVGMPGFVKGALLQRLFVEGVDASFDNALLDFGRRPSLIIENPAFRGSHQPLSPRLSANRAELALSWEYLLHGRIKLHSLEVSGAKIDLPISQTNGDVLSLTNVALDMDFDSNEIAQVDRCQGVFHGIQLDVIGAASHADEFLHWNIPSGNETNGVFQAHLRQIAQIADEVHFVGAPLLLVEVGADGRDMNSFHAEMKLTVPSARTPWGEGSVLEVNAACARLIHSGDKAMLGVRCSAATVNTPNFRGRRLSLATEFYRNAESNIDCRIALEAARANAAVTFADSNRIGATDISWNGTVTFAPTNLSPLSVSGKFHALQPNTPWASAGEISLQCHAVRATNSTPFDAGWDLWTKLAPWDFDWQTEVQNLASPKLAMDYAAFSGRWRAPQIEIDNLRGKLYDGSAMVAGSLNVASRELRAHGVTDFTPLFVTQLFSVPVQEWLAQLGFGEPPKVHAQVRVILPPWTNQPPGWDRDVDSSLQLAGNFTTGRASFLKVPVLSASSQILYSNRTWLITGLHAARPDGDMDMDYTSDPVSFHYLIDSRMDPKDALPIIAPGKPHLLDEFAFHQPPKIHTEIWGQWRDPNAIGVTGTVSATNFLLHAMPVAGLSAAVDYTNWVLTLRDLAASNAQCHAQSPLVQVDCHTRIVTLTNATGTLDAPTVRGAFRDNPPDFLDVIQFDQPAAVSASGWFSLTNPNAVDLHFLVSGQGVHYTNLTADTLSGQVDWTQKSVSVTNVTASLYHNGSLKGWIEFGDTNYPADFHADFTAKDIDLAALTTGLTGRKTQVEGRLDAHVTFDGPDNDDKDKWNGWGNVHVHDALLWDIKLFGLLSPVLNLMSPGWGHSRAREANATFVLDKGTLSTDDLTVRCQGFTVNVHGTLDKNKQLKGRLEAKLSKEGSISSFFSMAFTPVSKMFEYRISGPWSDPVLEPVYIPKFVLFLLHPFHTLKSIATPESPNQADSP
jgi:hypothetical protein